MELISERLINIKVLRHDFECFSYIERWENNRLKDCYFAYPDDLWPDGTVKPTKRKYFYSRESGTDIVKVVEPIKIDKFKWFNLLYYIDDNGDCVRIDGELAANCNYNSPLE